jgi:hypothetical protein
MTEELYNKIVTALPELKWELDHELSKMELEHSRRCFEDVFDMYAYDVTGQDGEYEKDEAARDWVAAQDRYIRQTDPDRWAEMRRGA